MTHDDNQVLRIPPHSLPAEQAVLGTLLLEHARAWPVVSDVVTAEAFFDRRHALTFAAIARLSDRHTAVDVVTVADELERTGELPEVGGLAFVGDLANNAPPGVNVRAHAEIVREHAKRREVIRIASAAIERAYKGKAPDQVVTDTESAFLTMSEHSAAGGPRSLDTILRGGYVAELEARAQGRSRGLTTGFSDLDRMVNGLRPQQFVVIAARPGEGKTTVAGNIVEHVAVRLGEPVLFFSLEMSEAELVDRFASSLSGVPLSSILDGDVSDPAFLPAIARLKDAPLHIDDSPALYAAQIRARALRMKRQHGLSLVVIDYLQLVCAKAESRFDEVSAISRAFKALAKELRCPVIALSQLNRMSERRIDKRPVKEDLRESGQIEQDADLICLLYRDPKLVEGLSVLELAKQRNGPTGRVILAAQLDRVRFRSHAGPAEARNSSADNWSPY